MPRRLAITALAVAACSSGRAGVPDRGPAPPRPAGCREVEVGGDVAAAIAAVGEGGAVCLAPGAHVGPIRIDRRITLWGPREAVVRGATGSVVVVAAAGARVAGFTIDGTGGRFDREDAAVQVVADDVTVEGLDVVHPVYGIVVSRAKRARVTGNHVHGDAGISMGMRGDTIRLWETDDSEISDNVVEDGRDIVVFYSNRNRIVRNRAVRGRYGTHLMYSHDNLVEDNRYLEGVVGVFVMYSHGDTLRRNLIADAGGAAGMAIGLKDSGNLVLENNVLIRDTTGIYIDASPNQAGDTVVIRGNVIRMCGVAVTFHTTPARIELTGNDLADNREQAQAGTGTDPTAARWHGNYFDDYGGYDLDGDGTGDVPHLARSTSEELIARHPGLAFFRGGPVLGGIDAASRLLPLWKSPTLLIDATPRMAPREIEEVLDAR